MKKYGLVVLLLEIMLIAGSCRGNKSSDNSGKHAAMQTKTEAEAPKPAAHVATPGEEAFRKACLTCHQADGSGVPGMYTPLSHADKVMGPPEGIIKAILFGLKGPSVINGKTYTQQMPAQHLLNDSTIAVLVNYVKQRWGDGESSVTADDVKKIRAAGKH
jgi:mono/diheme cytochrome c family protein